MLWTAASVLLVACSAAPSPTASTPPVSEQIIFGDATSVPVLISENDGTWTTDGGVVSVRLVNLGDSEVTVTRLEVVADEGLTVEYLGYSDCTRGCPGALRWDQEARQRVEQGRDGQYPITLRPLDDILADNDRAVSLMFGLTANDAKDVEALREGCLHLRAVVLETGDGSMMTVSAPDAHWIAAIHVEEPLPSGYRACDDG